MPSLMRKTGHIGALFIALVACGCSDPDECPPGGCGDPDAIGVPQSPVCGGDVCTEGVSCTEIVEASTQAELVAGAGIVGACVALAPGAYGDVGLARDTSLLGRWADEVSVGSVTALGGTIRGVQTTGIVVEGATLIDQVRVAAPQGRGIDVRPGSDVTIVQTEVSDASDHAIVSIDAVAHLDRVYVHDGAGPGVWLQGPGCEANASAPVTVDRLHVERAHTVGLALVGVDATVANTNILDTRQAPGVADGFGMSTADCTVLDVANLHVDGADAYGATLFATSGRLGSPGEDRGIIIVNGHTGGIWFEDTSADLTFDNFDIADSSGVGIGVGAESRGIIIVNGRVGNTMSASRPVMGGGQQQVGDGLLWGTGAQLSLDGLTLAGSGRNALLIDGAVAMGSAISLLTLEGADADKGIVQQSFEDGATSPSVGDGVPPIQQSPDALFDVPLSPPSLQRQ